VVDLRTAAFVSAVRKVATSYLELGVFLELAGSRASARPLGCLERRAMPSVALKLAAPGLPPARSGASRFRSMPSVALTNGVALHWRKQACLMVHRLIWIHGGSVEDSSMMIADLEPWLDRVRALLPDTRGHGRSTHFERVEDYTYVRKAEDLLLWIDALGVPDAIWGGVSMGAALSLWIASHRAVSRAGGHLHQRASVRGAGKRSALVGRAPAPGRGGTHRDYFDANVRLRMGDDGLARLKAKPSVTPSSSRCSGGTRRLRCCAPRRDVTLARIGSTSVRASGVRCS